MIRNLSYARSPLALLLCLAPVAPKASAEIVEYSSGHADIGVAYEDGELHPHWHFGSNAVLDGNVSGSDMEFEPGEAYVRVPDTARIDYASAPNGLEFTGLTPGEEGSIWFLPENPTPGLPRPGLAAEEGFNSPDWEGDITWALTSASRPDGGQVSLWKPDALGGPPNVFFASADGLDSNDEFSFGIGTHDHFAWGFTEEGVYDLTLSVSGTHLTDGFRTSSGTFKFVVGPSAVPEAGTATLLALGSLGLVVGGLHQRRRRGTSPRPTA